MKKSLLLTFAIALTFGPAGVFAHPGHMDGAPVAHALWHDLYYFFAALAVGIMTVPHVSRLLRSNSIRKRQPR